MCSTSSAASADSVSDLSEPECVPLPSAKLIPTAEQCSQGTGRECAVTAMFKNSTQLSLLSTELAPMSSAEDSRARTLALRERAQGSLASARDYGASTPVSLANFDRDSSSWRTSQRCLVEGWTRYSETWPRSGLMRNGIAYQLPPLVPLTVETESGLLPTPVTVDSGAYFNRSASSGAALRPTLGAMAKHNLWPTPVAPNGGRSIRHADEWRGKTPYHKGKKIQVDLAAAVRMWPTPLARDFKGPGMSKARIAAGRKPDNLSSAVRFHTPRTTPRSARELDGVSPLGGGGLNPAWVEWLMGFPLGWTVLDASATPLSRKSQKSSGAQS
jgi:hypothetical protein